MSTVIVKKASYELPEELFLAVMVVGSEREVSPFPEMFSKARCFKADTIEEADLVVFAGGPDVTPALYGAEKHQRTASSPTSDKRDMIVYKECFERGIPMLGICRGAQFLHVMNGGTLYQHVEGHYGDHGFYDTVEKKAVHPVSSVHHQMAIENDKMTVLAVRTRSADHWVDNNTNDKGAVDEVEAFFYPDTLCLGVQGHPEYSGYDKFLCWTIKKIQQYLVDNPDIENRKIENRAGCLRLKDEALETRPQQDWDELIVKEEAKALLNLKGDI